MSDLISVIVPVFNAERTLPRCLESLVNQTYRNLEIILINDGSQDKSLEICNRYVINDSRIKVVDKENTGVSDTRNMGLDIAIGDWAAFVDSDDYIELNMYEKMIKLGTDDLSQVVACKFNLVHGEYQEEMKEPFIEAAFSGELKYFISMNNSVHGGVARLLIKRDFVKDLRFAKDVKIKEDLLFTIQIMKNVTKASVLNECLYNYVVADNDLNYKKYYSEKYIKDFNNFNHKIYEILSGHTKYLPQLQAMFFRHYLDICKCMIYDKNVKSLNYYFTKEELKFSNNKQNYKEFINQEPSIKTRFFAMLAHKKMYSLLNALQKTIDIKKNKH